MGGWVGGWTYHVNRDVWAQELGEPLPEDAGPPYLAFVGGYYGDDGTGAWVDGEVGGWVAGWLGGLGQEGDGWTEEWIGWVGG